MRALSPHLLLSIGYASFRDCSSSRFSRQRPRQTDVAFERVTTQPLLAPTATTLKEAISLRHSPKSASLICLDEWRVLFNQQQRKTTGSKKVR